MGLIRLILALTVVYGHLHIYIPGFKSFGNEVAVQTFFVISGFYMTLVLNEKYLPKPGIYWAFIKNRILRLYPSYAVVCVVSLVIGLILASNGHPTEFFKAWSGDPVTANFGTKALAAITHFTIIGQDLPLFMAQDAGGAMYWTANFQQAPYSIWKLWINPPAWSLGLELMFYSIAPFLVRRSLKQVVPIILACYLLRMVIKYYFHLGDDPWSYRFFPTELSSFLLGTVAYHIYKKKINLEWIKGKESAIIAAGIAALMLAPYIPHFKALFYPFLMVTIIPFVFAASKSNRRDRNLGELSYPIYICHWPMLMFLNEYDFFGLAKYARIPVMLGLTIVVAVVLYNFIDAPVEKLRQALAKKAIAA